MTDARESESDLPLVDPADVTDGTDEDETAGRQRGEPTVAGVLLAAGTGSRFGDANKLLATLDGEPIVRRAGRTLVDAGLDPLVAVVGYEAERVAAALDGLPVRIVENDAYREGQSTSVRAGVDAVGEHGVGAAVFALGDMPCVAPASVRALVTVYRGGRWTALAAACDGRRGNPVLFDSRRFDALAAVSGDRGGRRLLGGSERAALVETNDPGVLRDVDTAADLDRLHSSSDAVDRPD